LYKFISLLLLLIIVTSCETEKDDTFEVVEAPKIITPTKEYGYTMDDFHVVRDTIQSGDTFGAILNEYGVSQNKIVEVALKFQDSFDVRKIVVGKPFVLLNSKDSIHKTEVFIYEKNKTDYAVVDFRDSVAVYTGVKQITYVERIASGVITSSLSQTMAEQNLSPNLTDRLANIYAWTVNFFHLPAGDRFKIIYTEKYINDTIPAGLHEIKAAYFEHRGVPLYAISFETDSIKRITDFYDESANNLRRAFLKAPVQFSRISSRYNLKRRIKYYGYKLRPHRGTDFAARIGTPILATADGTISKSERRGGNGNYVKIRHNATYETQYLHMQKRNVRVGDFVRQGDVIGWIGMTGNTGGPHVCYRFWKNGKEVDPFSLDLPQSKPLPSAFHEEYFAHLAPLKDQLDCIEF